jgi:hypothetical protein
VSSGLRMTLVRDSFAALAASKYLAVCGLREARRGDENLRYVDVQSGRPSSHAAARRVGRVRTK